MSTDAELSRGQVLLCRATQWATLAIAAIMIVSFWAVNGADRVIDMAWNELSAEQRAVLAFSDAKRATLRALAWAASLDNLLVLFGMWTVFGAFARSPLISVKAARTVRLLGVFLLVQAVSNLVSKPLMLLAMTGDSPPGHRVLSLSLSTDNAFEALFGALFIVLGHVVTRAVAIAEENRQFI